VYGPEQIDDLVKLYLGGADRDKLDPILDACVAVYVETSTKMVRLISKARRRPSVRTYDFLATILPYGVQDWEKLSIFLNFLIPKLPSPQRRRPVQRHSRSHRHGQLPRRKEGGHGDPLPDAENAEIDPVPTSGGGTEARAGVRQALEHREGL
jgi:type I restriction enzyme R subunit